MPRIKKHGVQHPILQVVYCASSPSEELSLETRNVVDAAGPVAVCRALQDVQLIQSRKTGDKVLDKGQRTATPAKLTIDKYVVT